MKPPGIDAHRHAREKQKLQRSTTKIEEVSGVCKSMVFSFDRWFPGLNIEHRTSNAERRRGESPRISYSHSLGRVSGGAASGRNGDRESASRIGVER